MSTYASLDAVGLGLETARGARSARQNVEDCFAAVEALDRS